MLLIEPDEPISLDRLGPQAAGDTLHARRCRFHQSWFRSAVLGLETFGGSLATRGRLSGSVLSLEDGAAGKNFLNAEAADAYAKRREEGWGVDPQQTTRHMVSSQALMFNMFAPLAADLAWFSRCLAMSLDRPDIRAVTKVAFEFAPALRSNYLGDMTRIDLLVDIETEGGPEVVTVELKYADRFNSRTPSLGNRPEYRDLAARTGIWRDASAALESKATNQLLRMHALAVVIAERDREAGTKVSCLVIHHSRDKKAVAHTTLYRDLLTDAGQVRHVELGAFVEGMQHTAQEQRGTDLAAALWRRYVDDTESDALWIRYFGTGQSRVRWAG
jgi:hypothetical protein